MIVVFFLSFSAVTMKVTAALHLLTAVMSGHSHKSSQWSGDLDLQSDLDLDLGACEDIQGKLLRFVFFRKENRKMKF